MDWFFCRRRAWSVRLLLLIMGVFCVYFACWGPTRERGVMDVVRYVENGSTPVLTHVVFNASARAPLIVSVDQSFTVGDFAGDAPVVRAYYLWLFGHVMPLPFERAVPSTSIDLDLPFDVRDFGLDIPAT